MADAIANQYIGSRISLISKSEIRYEGKMIFNELKRLLTPKSFLNEVSLTGILYSLDLQEATISLAKVKSFGTEDRPTERPVPPKDEIYEFIIFRGSDIKGIDVVEPPKTVAEPEPANHGLPNDPAIVEVSSQHYHSPASAASGPSSLAQQHPTTSYNAFAGMKSSENKQQPFSSTTAVISPLQQQQPGVALAVGGGPRSESSIRSSSPKFQSPSSDRAQIENRQDGRGRGRGRSQGQPFRGGQQYRGGNERGNYNYRGFNRGGRPPMSHRGSFNPTPSAKVTFEEPFDFEKSNEELLLALMKLKVAGEEKQEEPNSNEEHTIFYSKDNFFDNISCEASERSKGISGRPDWRAERKLNAETFGLSANRRGGGHFYRGRSGGFYRGGNGYNNPRGYGFSRGGSGGYYNNNNRGM